MNVPVVQPIEVDVVGLQAAEGILACGDYRFAPGAAGVGIAWIKVAAELRRDDQTVPLGSVAADMIADDLLRMAFGVAVRGIDEVAAELDEAIENLLGFFHAGTPAVVLAEGHCAEAQRAHAQARAAKGHIGVEGHR